MSAREHVHSLVDSVRPVVAAVPPDALAAPTTCADWDVRSLVNRMLGTAEAMGGQMQRAMVGDLGYVEAMLHGRDLARPTRQEVG